MVKNIANLKPQEIIQAFQKLPVEDQLRLTLKFQTLTRRLRWKPLIKTIRSRTKSSKVTQSQINKIADPDCTLFGLKGFAGRIGLTEDQVKYLKRKNSKKTNPLNLDWLDEICGTTACNPVSADNYKQRLNDTAEEQEGKRGRPRNARSRGHGKPSLP